METVVDDVKVFSRALTAIEIQQQYQPDASLPSIDVQLNGVDDAVSPLDKLQVDLDYHPLPAAWQTAIQNGLVSAQAVLAGPGGITLTDAWQPADLNETRIMSGGAGGGDYVYTLTLTDPSGQMETVAQTITRPNTDWFGNSLGTEDEVPTPWTPMTVDDSNTVNIWGRTYYFGNHPFPYKIVHSGDSMLTAPPALVVETGAGPVDKQ